MKLPTKGPNMLNVFPDTFLQNMGINYVSNFTLKEREVILKVGDIHLVKTVSFHSPQIKIVQLL